MPRQIVCHLLLTGGINLLLCTATHVGLVLAHRNRREGKMTPVAWTILIVGIIAVVGIFLLFTARTKKLKSQFGPEYDRQVKASGNTLKAEQELEHRAKRVHNFQIHPLSEPECEQFAREWRGTQEKFVDDPRAALADADRLVNKAMETRGYPVAGEFDQKAADLSVEHPLVVEHYRAGHQIAEKDARDGASTEDLRIAMKHYRELFEDLLGRHVDETTGARR